MTVLPGLDCNHVVELVTDLLDGDLDAVTARRVEQHLTECPGCDAYVEQIHRTVGAPGGATVEGLSPQAQQELVHAFRTFHRGA